MSLKKSTKKRGYTMNKQHIKKQYKTLNTKMYYGNIILSVKQGIDEDANDYAIISTSSILMNCEKKEIEKEIKIANKTIKYCHFHDGLSAIKPFVLRF